MKISNNISFKKCHSTKQNCAHCGKLMGKGSFGMSINNAGDNLVIRKNVWIHCKCINEFADFVKRQYKNNYPKLMANTL